MKDIHEDFAAEIVRVIELGINKHINSSIIYSPFKLFYNLFSKSNPKTMDSVRQFVSQDVYAILVAQAFDFDSFVDGYDLLPKSDQLLKSFYALGISLFKTKLTPIKAFKLISNPRFRQEFYDEFLVMVSQMVNDPILMH